jgi:hypothetical protein
MQVESTQAILSDRIGSEQSEKDGTSKQARTGEEAKDRQDAAESDAVRQPNGGTGGNEGSDRHLSAASKKQVVRRVSLRLTRNERDFMYAMASILDGLPRRTLRFINTYQIIKGSFDSADVDALEAQGYRALITLVALGIIAEDDFPRIVAALIAVQTNPTAPLDVDGVISAAQIHSSDTIERVRLGFGLAKTATNEEFAKYALLAVRFSFHQGLNGRRAA